MPRTALHTDEIPLDPVNTITDDNQVNDIVEVDAYALANQDYMNDLKMAEEPVTIEIYPSSDRNAPTHYHCQVNGSHPEVLDQSGRWVRLIHPYIQVGQQLTVKRKYVEVLVRAKTFAIQTRHDDIGSFNHIIRTPSAVANVQIIEDKNPRGIVQFSTLRRQAY
jgi:hypothetical protein